MKWKMAFLALMLMLPLAAGADTYVKIERHSDGYYRGGTMTPPVDESRDLWISPARVVYITEGQKMLLDAEKGVLIYVNLGDNSYVETELPVDMSRLFAEQDYARLQMFQRTGEIKALEGKKKIGKWECAGYEMSDWITYQGGKVNEREVTVWVTTDVPFDLAKFDALFVNLRRLGNLADGYIEKLNQAKGFVIISEETTYAEGLAMTTTTKVVEIADREAPPEVFAIPEGCTKKETLSLQDL